MPPLGIWGHLGVWGLSGPCLRRRSAARRTQPVSAGQRQLGGLCWGRADTQLGILHQEPGENGARQPVPREMTGGEEPRGGAGPGLTSVLAAWPLGASVSSSVKGATPRSCGGGGAPRPEGLQFVQERGPEASPPTLSADSRRRRVWNLRPHPTWRRASLTPPARGLPSSGRACPCDRGHLSACAGVGGAWHQAEKPRCRPRALRPGSWVGAWWGPQVPMPSVQDAPAVSSEGAAEAPWAPWARVRAQGGAPCRRWPERAPKGAGQRHSLQR